MKKTLLLAFMMYVGMLYSQVGINKNANNPDPSAMLDIQSTDSGLLIPRMTGAERDGIVNPATGLLVYVTDDHNFYSFNGNIWVLASGDNLGNHKAGQNLEMQGNWISNDGDDEGIFVTDMGEIGIGTNNPDGRLHILMDDNTKNIVLERNEEAKRNAGIRFYRSRGSASGKAALQDKDGIVSLASFGYDGSDYSHSALIAYKVDGTVSSGIVPAKIIFQTQSQNDWAERMVIRNNGKVGIGTDNPVGTLHLKGDDPDLDLDINSGSSPKKIEVRFKEDGNQKAKMYYQKDTKQFVFEQLSTGLMSFNINFVPAMVVDQNRNVGIGVTAPERTLHIKDVLRINPSDEPSNPADGDIYLDNTSKKLRCYVDGAWHDLW